MSFFSPPAAPAPPPPPPPPVGMASPSIIQAGASERRSLASAGGMGFNGTDVTGGQGAAAPATTKSLLGG